MGQHKKQVLLALVLASAFFRGVYYYEFSQGPGLWQHHAEQTDMHFFDLWAEDIAQGDWLTNRPLHSIQPWMTRISRLAIETHPELKKSLLEESSASGVKDLDVLLWDRWAGGKCFNQHPLYAYLVATTYFFLGHDVRWVFLWQMLLGIGSVVLVYLIGCRYFGYAAGTAAGIFAALHSPMMYYELLLLRDGVMIFFTLLLIYLCGNVIERKSLFASFCFGLAAGLAILLKGTFSLYIFSALAVLGFTFRKEWKVLLRHGGVIAAGILLVMAPFVARNIHVGVPAFTFSNPSAGALTVIVCNSADFDEEGEPMYRTRYAPKLMVETEGHFLPACIATLATHPSVWSVVRLGLLKINSVLHWYETPNNDNFYYASIHSRILAWLPATFLLLAPLAICGFVLSLSNLKETWPLHLAIPCAMAPLLIATMISRFRIPFAVALIPFAAFMAVKVADWALQKRAAPTLAAGASVALLALWIGRPLPMNQPLIRTGDYLGPCEYYYQPSIDAALKAENWNRAMDLIEDALATEPEFLRNFPARPLQSADERLAARTYSWLHGAYAHCVKPEESALHLRRANELKQAGESN